MDINEEYKNKLLLIDDRTIDFLKEKINQNLTKSLSEMLASDDINRLLEIKGKANAYKEMIKFLDQEVAKRNNIINNR